MQTEKYNKKNFPIFQPLINAPSLSKHDHVKLELQARNITGITLSKKYNLNRTTAAISKALSGEIEPLLNRIILFINRFDKKKQFPKQS
jgi:hypothetical protein